MSEEKQELAKLPKTLTAKINGEERELMMSFGLLNELARATGSIEEVQMIMIDSDRLPNLVNLVIAVRDDKGRIDPTKSPDVNVGDIMELDTFDEISKWMLGHVMRFFVRRARVFAEASQPLGPELKALNKLANGFES